MKTFRHLLQGPLGRIVTAVLLLSTAHLSADPSTYLTVVAQERQKEAEIRGIAAKMNIDPEFLLNPQGRKGFDFRSLFRQVAERFGIQSESLVATNDQPVDIRESVKRVKERYALVAADTVIARIAQLVQMSPDAVRGKKKGQIKAELQSLLRLIDKDFLPPVKDNASGTAKSRDAEMRRELKDLQKRVKSVLNGPHALDEENLESTLADLRNAVSGTISVRHGKPRWTRDPFPVKDTYRIANVKPAGPGYDDDATGANAVTPAVISAAQTAPAPSTPVRLRASSNAVATEVTALANTLGTPAKIFAWVHDNIDWESYSGVAKGPLGALNERRGNDWDQALLLRDLLSARGYNAQLEWGRVTLPMAKAMNLVGTEDPLQAANLLATAGFDGLVLTSKGQPIAIQMTHAWVRAYIPYIPNRGATGGTPDTWVRMDPSFKRYEYQAGIAINGKVAWNEDEYLQTSNIRPPAEFYGDKIWSYIRTNDIDCVNLAQVAKAGRIKAANLPFVPATLTTKIESVAGLAQLPPNEQMQSVTMTVTDINGAVLSSYTTSLADVWGRKLSITFPPATPDDASTIASYGGLFNTPAYLIKLKPVFSIDDQPVADGSPVAAGAVLDLNTTFRQPNVADDFTHHELVAGETHAMVFDPGSFPDSLIEARINRLKTLTNEEAALSEKLFLVGLRYMQHVDDGISFSAGVRWQRPVKRVFEADVRRQIDITYNVAGAAIRLTPAENNIDVSRLLVGIVPINNDLSQRASALALAGLQSSYLEGAIWEEMESQQGISATKALLLARMAGQQMYTVNASNVNTVLNTVNLSAEVENEIRGAVAQGRIAKIASTDITLGRWTGTGYILQDPQTGAATYPISGGLAGGSSTGKELEEVRAVLGIESWAEGNVLADVLRDLIMLVGGSVGPKGAPSTTQSDPVNMASGNMFRGATDFSIPARGISVVLTRIYNSRSTYDGPFGYGWTFNYGEQLVQNADGSVLYRETDGTEHLFTLDGSSYVAPAGKHVELTRNGSGWILRAKDGRRSTFNVQGSLVALTDLNGNTVTINHDANGYPSTVVDAGGRTVLTFTVTGGKITNVQDLGGRQTQYTYTGDDLVNVVDVGSKTWTMAYDLSHNMTAFTEPGGHTQSYAYDVEDRLMQHVDAAGAEELFQYDAGSRQSVITDKRGGDRLIGYDGQGRATMEADPAGNVIRATFDADNNRTSIVDARGFAFAMDYDAQGNVTREVNPDGSTIVSTFDANSRPLTLTNSAGSTTANSFDTNGNLVASSRTVGGVVQTTTHVYGTHGELLSTTDPTGGVTTNTWDPVKGTMVSRTDPGQNVTTMVTDEVGRVTSVKDAANNETVMTYDARGRRLTSTDSFGNTTATAYDETGRRTAVTTPSGTIRYEYDAEGRVVSFTNALGQKETTTYNAAGDVTARTDARGNVTRYEYDVAGRQTRMIDASGGVWTYGYCNDLSSGASGVAMCSSCGVGTIGDYCEITDPNGNTLKQAFDKMGRVTSVTDARGQSAFTQYDGAGRKILETDANGNATSFTYDDAGRLLTVKEASGAITSFTYDANGNKLTQKNPNGQTWSFKYDALSRVIEESDPLGRKTSYTYDAVGNPRTKTDPKGQTTTYTYNSRRLMSVAYADGTTDTYTYDTFGRRTAMANSVSSMSYTYDSVGRITSTKNVRNSNATISYEYDAEGNRTAMTTSKGRVAYTYDPKNRLTAIVDPVFGTYRFAYDAMDRRTELKYPNGITTSYTYDNGYRLTALVSKNNAGAIVDAWSYQYDAAGNRTSKTDMDGRSDIFRYDNVYRLTEASYADGTSERFAYDPAGNRLTRTSESGVTSYTYDAANQLTRVNADTLTYDANGSLTAATSGAGTTTFTWNAANRLTAISGPAGTESSEYRPDGQRNVVNSPAAEGTIQPEYDLDGNPVLDKDSGGANVWIYRLYGPGVDEVLGEWRRGNGRIIYPLRDALGSITAMTATDGRVMSRYAFRAFGGETRSDKESGAAPPSRIGFTGRERSIGSLMQYRSRYYDTSAGRFLQQDSDPGQSNLPPSLHRYTYVHNNPVVYIDPTGMGAINPFPGTPQQKTCAVLLASIMWLTADIEKRISELKPGSLPDFGPNSMFGHCIQIEARQISLMLHVNEFFKRCRPPNNQPDWSRVQAAYAEDPLPVAFPQTSSKFEIWWPGLIIAGAALILIAILAAPVAVVAYAAAAMLAILFLGTWVGTQFLWGEYRNTSLELLTNV